MKNIFICPTWLMILINYGYKIWPVVKVLSKSSFPHRKKIISDSRLPLTYCLHGTWSPLFYPKYTAFFALQSVDLFLTVCAWLCLRVFDLLMVKLELGRPLFFFPSTSTLQLFRDVHITEFGRWVVYWGHLLFVSL